MASQPGVAPEMLHGEAQAAPGLEKGGQGTRLKVALHAAHSLIDCMFKVSASGKNFYMSCYSRIS